MAPEKKARIAPSGRTKHPLASYWAKRRFDITREPAGTEDKPARPTANRILPFVVQKHAASHLHYDFRLGWEGVLKSWAVAKGPSYYPGDKRLAVMVEDHPWEYRTFEGTIPKGEYGGGSVMVWDEGEWTPHGDVNRGLAEGHLKFELNGKKLKGDWVLIRMNGSSRGNDRSAKTNWLLIKEKDKFARGSRAKAITEEAPDSAVSGTSIEQIGEQSDRVWKSKQRNGERTGKEADTGKIAATGLKKGRVRPHPGLAMSPKERFPAFIEPQLARQADAAPAGGDWRHELKLDGYRIQTHVGPAARNGSAKHVVRLLTRNGLDWTSRMPDIADAAAQLNVESAILDGEAVVLDDHGVSNFADLQAVFNEGRQKYITYFVFDLLHLDGHNLRALSLRQRQEILAGLLGGVRNSPLRLSEAIEGDGPTVYAKACALKAEGIISKQASAPYVSGRSNDWLKAKCRLDQEFVIGGFTLPSNGSRGVGALMLGYFHEGKLRYAGRSGTGFTQAIHRLLRKKLDAITIARCPFADVSAAMQRGVKWVKPELVAQISFSTWTRDGQVRQAAFKGLREDKPAAEVVRETA